MSTININYFVPKFNYFHNSVFLFSNHKKHTVPPTSIQFHYVMLKTYMHIIISQEKSQDKITNQKYHS